MLGLGVSVLTVIDGLGPGPVMVKVRARIRDSYSTKRMGTKRLGYEMSRSPYRMALMHIL